MSLHRFHTPDLHHPFVQLPPDQAQHARRVLRLQPGDPVELFDGSGTVARGQITDLGKTLTIEITQRHTLPPLQPQLDLAVALPKGPRADTLIEKLSELGADRLIPLQTTRSTVDPREGKLQRFERLALESAKQCHRPYLLQINEPTSLPDLLASADHNLKLIADVPHADETALFPERQQLAHTRRLLVLIGPEGGWTDEERAAARAAGCRPWTFGPYVLRIETAALAAAALLRQHARLPQLSP